MQDLCQPVAAIDIVSLINAIHPVTHAALAISSKNLNHLA